MSSTPESPEDSQQDASASSAPSHSSDAGPGQGTTVEAATPQDKGPEPARGGRVVRRSQPLRSGVPKFTLAIVTLGAAWLAFSLLHELSAIIAPMFLALNLMITAYPLHRFMVRHHVPKGLSAIITGLLVVLVLFGFLAGIAWSVAATISQMQNYGSQLSSMYSSALDLLTRFGWDQDYLLDKVKSINPQQVVGVAGSVLSDTTSALTLITVMVVGLIFMIMDTAEFGGRVDAIGRQKPGVAAALSNFGDGIRRYWLVTTLFGLIVAVLDWGVLVVMGVPLALVWALFSFLTNYVPNIGFIIGVIPPAMMALFAKGWIASVIVVAAYCVLNFVVQSIIQPKFAGDAVGLTPTMSFVSLLLWGWVFGGLGTLIALPCSLLVKSLLIDPDPDARWINALISSRGQDRDDDPDDDPEGSQQETRPALS